MPVTFDVSDVPAPERQRIAHVTALRAITARAGAIEAGACNRDALVAAEMHPFVQAADVAFDRHVGLVLSPDDVWLCIAQGFAHHVERNAERLRERFVRHQGKVELVVERNNFVKGSPDNDWPGVFDEFSADIAAHIGKQRDLVVCDFSTTGAVEKAASEIVLMSAMKSYFDFTVVTLCGIPRVMLLGTLEDWQSVRRRARHLAEYELEPWVKAMSPILDELCAAAAGKPDRAMWQSFYKYESESGGDTVSGWINTLFPFLEHRGTHELVPNPHVATWQNGDGPPSTMFPSGLSCAPFTWKYLGTPYAMEFIAGFTAITRDDVWVGPAIGWGVRGPP